jgi:hypothetical protein
MVLAMSVAPHARAQYAPAPEAYSVTQINSMFGPAVTMEIYRDGSKVLIDQSHAALPGGTASHLRTLYDLETHRNFTWDLLNSAVPCGGGTFSGDWGDPFAMSAEMTADLAKQHATAAGSATLNGIPVKVFSADSPQGQVKAWVDEKYGLLVRLMMAPKAGAPQTMIETRQLTVGKPAAALFKLPPACAEAAKAPRVPTEAEQIAADTGGNAQDYANASMPPPSKNSCSMLFKVVHAGSLALMEPTSGKFQVAIDTTVDLDHPAHYVMGLSNAGQSTFSGGGLHEVTGQMRNGVLRIENVPPQFDMELTFGKGGAASALIYRQCYAPQTTLLLVVKNPDKLSDGARWLWVKSGK